MAPMYPIFLDVSQFVGVIVGGGEVAARKARGLAAAGCGVIRVVAREFASDFPESVTRVTESYRAEHLDGADLVFAATDSSGVNDTVVRDARERGILVSRADVDADGQGDFIVPAKLQQGSLQIAVSASSAALSVAIRDALKDQLNPAWTQMAEEMKSLRPRLLRHPSLTIEQRRAIFRDLATTEALETLHSFGREALWRWVEARHPEIGSNV
jgi:precorrin-2 dehydrogenase / sirohydrochlorin ferrochelatase